MSTDTLPDLEKSKKLAKRRALVARVLRAREIEDLRAVLCELINEAYK